MAITRFQDLPSENTPINSENLNGNFDELGVKVGTSVDNNYRTNIIKSKNLLNYTIPSTTNWGVTTSMSDGKLILDGTTTGNSVFIYYSARNILLLKAGTYTISATKISGTYQKNNKDTAIYIAKVDDDTILFSVTSGNDYSRATTITLTEDTLIHLNIYTNGSGMVFTNLVVDLQIERGSTATDFEIPITPSINVDGETIYTKGQSEEYSTNETRIGTWIDGKPLYRKVINTISPSNEIGEIYNASSLNIDNIINMYCVISCVVNFGSGDTRLKVKLPYYYADNDAGTIWLEGDNINLRLTGSTYRGQSTILFLEYTKTTDA